MISVALKTEVRAAENSAFHLHEQITFYTIDKNDNSYFKLL